MLPKLSPISYSPIIVEKHVDYVFEKVGICGREKAILYLVNSFLELWKFFIVISCIVPEKAILVRNLNLKKKIKN